MTFIPYNFAQLGVFPSAYAEQREWFDRLITELNKVTSYIEQNTSDVVVLEQATLPTQMQWEAAWTAQTGKPTPISQNATLFWWDTSINDFGGIFGVMRGDNTVRPHQARFPQNANVLLLTSETLLSAGGQFYIGDNIDIVPDITFTSPIPLTLELYYEMGVTYSAGTDPVGIDFLFDGIKVGTSQYGLAQDTGITNRATTGVLRCRAFLPNVPAGTHTVRLMYGATGSPVTLPTVAINAAGASHQMIVRGLSQ